MHTLPRTPQAGPRVIPQTEHENFCLFHGQVRLRFINQELQPERWCLTTSPFSLMKSQPPPPACFAHHLFTFPSESGVLTLPLWSALTSGAAPPHRYLSGPISFSSLCIHMSSLPLLSLNFSLTDQQTLPRPLRKSHLTLAADMMASALLLPKKIFTHIHLGTPAPSQAMKC